MALEVLRKPVVRGMHPDGWGLSRRMNVRPGAPFSLLCVKHDYPGRRSDSEPIYDWHPFIETQWPEDYRRTWGDADAS